MQIKLLQLNMWAGTKMPAIEKFITENDFDILCLQEIDGPGTYAGNVKCAIDCFKKLRQVLGKTHQGILAKASTFTSSPTSYDGNAIFYRNNFSLISKDIIWFYQRSTPFPSGAKSYEDVGRNALHLQLEIEGKIMSVVSAHLPWATTKQEQPHQTTRNQALISFAQTAQTPWIISGDFNVTPQQPTILALEKYGRDLTKEYGIVNTIDSTLHTRWQEFAPGEAFDYIFVSSDIQVEHFQALDNVHLSDHFGLSATVEI